jgi:hypothetical protein
MGGSIETSYFGKDLTYMIGDLWSAVTGLGTNTASASVTDLANASELDVGGEVFRITQNMVVSASAVSTPSIGSLCTVSGVERMVGAYSVSPDGLSYSIDLAEITT